MQPTGATSELDGALDAELDDETDVTLDEEISSLDIVVVLVVVSLEVVVALSLEEKGMLGKTTSQEARSKVIKPTGMNKCFFIKSTFNVFYHFKLKMF